MQCTPESSLYLDGYKGQHCYDDCSDSGYSGFFQSPHSTSGADSCRSLSPVELDETPKENLRVSVTPKKKIREQVRFLGRDSRKVSAVSWCETPKICKRDTSLRQRLLLCKPTADVKNDNTRSPGSEPYFNTSFDSVDTEMGAASALKVDQDLPLSGRKRRVLFMQVRTSTLEDGKHNCCHLPSFEKEASLTDLDMSEHIFASGQCNSPLGSMTDNLYNGSSVLCTPSSDSGFSSVTLDKSQDSTVDHDGSFQELLLSASKGNSETPNPTEGRRRSRLQRQHRLSTLKEGGSQSEEDPTDRKHQHPYQCYSHSKEDEVFAEDITPRSVLSVKCVNLSLTPALQLVQAICQHHAQMLAGQSPSLKEQLKSAAALTKTPSTLRTTMPLAGLIGRKMGLEKVDVLTELMKRNLRHILAVILCQMDSESVRARLWLKFCMSCLCTSHGSRECGSQSAGRRRKDILPGSAQSKRNVKRL
uniref:F-box protein 43 n=1 Tax=Neolamprologus brichardi TaxID=32507 RepID=A0A3Q4M763_NEOBR